jgi:hypothetical protein
MHASHGYRSLFILFDLTWTYAIIIFIITIIFYQIPEHYEDESPPVAMKAPQKLLRQSIVGIFPTGDTQPEMYPR